MSITQAAVAIVGAIVGSSLLTIIAFVLVLRYKRRRRYRRSVPAVRTRAGSVGYPGLQRSSNDMAGGPDEKGSYAVDIKPPEPTAQIQTQRVGFAPAIGANRASFHLRTAPKGKYSVFPRSADEGKRDVELGSPSSQYSVEQEKEKVQGGGERKSSMYSPPSLDKWLRVGTDVSPFGTLNVITGGKERKQMGMGSGRNWPLDRKGSS